MRVGGSGVGSYISPGSVYAGANTNKTLETHFTELSADIFSAKIATIQKAMITEARVKRLIAEGTITFYDGARPVTTTIPGIINRIYNSINSISNRVSAL